ncbi:hypothetical protein EG835_00025 [bacterium]|nr:hypothetical protein [bacterium]
MPELDAPTSERQTRRLAIRLAVSYMVAAIVWIVVTDWAETLLDLSGPVLQLVNTGKGILFVLVTGALLYSFAQRFLTGARIAHNRYRQAQEQLRLRERSIEQAYIDVLASVTGGKLILMWPDDVADHLGEVVLPAESISSPSQLSAARAHLDEVLAELGDRYDEALLAANEGLTNALKHAGGGEYEVRRTPFALQIVITDHGPGIDFNTLPRATLIAGYSTKSTLGIGFTIMFDAAERILLATRRGLTTLVLEFPSRVT